MQQWKILSFDPEGVMLSGVSQAAKDKYRVVSLIREGHFQANLFPRQGLYSSHPDDGLEISSDILCSLFLVLLYRFPPEVCIPKHYFCLFRKSTENHIECVFISCSLWLKWSFGVHPCCVVFRSFPLLHSIPYTNAPQFTCTFFWRRALGMLFLLQMLLLWKVSAHVSGRTCKRFSRTYTCERNCWAAAICVFNSVAWEQTRS